MLSLLVGVLLAPGGLPATRYFGVHVVDRATGRGVPLVRLETVNKLEFITDSAGYIALLEPGLMHRKVFFTVSSPGYTFPKDGFGYSGAALQVEPGKVATLTVDRTNIAERLCRLTGEGIYRDSILLGLTTPRPDDSPVLGQDTAQAVVFKGRMLWFWGDTDRIDYPLGNFHTTGAVGSLPHGRSTAIDGVDYRYFGDGRGFVQSMAQGADSHPIWLSGLTIIGSRSTATLYAYYAEIKSLGNILSSGYLKWDDTNHRFDHAMTFAAGRDWKFLDGHTNHVTEGGKEYVVGGFPCTTRVGADAASLLDASAYQAFTCVGADGHVVRRADGVLDYRWQNRVGPMTAEQEQRLIKAGEIHLDEARFLPRDASGDTIFPHGGCAHWNRYRKKWIAIFTRLHGTDSELGEIYYSEADAPTGPYTRAVKIFTHDRYTFYNPVHHPFLDEDGGRFIYIEGTYTAEFSGAPHPAPRYNYNQILYRLDLSDRRLRS